MKIRARLRLFWRADSGTVSADWIVLTAAFLALQVYLLLEPIKALLLAKAQTTSEQIENYDVFLPKTPPKPL